jgi:hypothetical protein
MKNSTKISRMAAHLAMCVMLGVESSSFVKTIGELFCSSNRGWCGGVHGRRVSVFSKSIDDGQSTFSVDISFDKLRIFLRC